MKLADIENPATLAAIADCVQILGYLAAGALEPTQGVALAFKLALLYFRPRKSSFTVAAPVIGLILFLNLFSMGVSPFWDEWVAVQVVTFAVSIATTMALLNRHGDIYRYAATVAVSIAATNALYLLMAMVGRIDIVYGRHLYFGASSASLGAEISAVGVITACIALRRRYLIPAAAAGIAVILMTQGRAALIASVLAVAIRGLFEVGPFFKRAPVRAAAVTAVSLPLAGWLLAEYGYSVVAAVLMLDDPNRGAGTGFVGRDIRWQQAMEMFWNRPVIGNGPAGYTVLHMDSPHNFYYYGIAQFGLLFSFVLAAFLFYAFRATRRAPKAAAILASALVLTVFNDRFANLAPYPFIIYVLLFGFAALRSKAEVKEAVRAKLLRSAILLSSVPEA